MQAAHGIIMAYSKIINQTVIYFYFNFMRNVREETMHNIGKFSTKVYIYPGAFMQRWKHEILINADFLEC